MKECNENLRNSLRIIVSCSKIVNRLKLFIMIKKAVSLLFVFLTILDVSLIMWNFYALPDTMFGLYPNLFKITKVAFLPLVLINYLMMTPVVSKLVLLFILLQWIGDIILLKPGICYTALGGFFFGLGHILMMIFFKVDIRKVKLISYLISIPPIVFMYSLIFPYMKWDHPTDYGCLVYCTILLASHAFAAGRLYKYSFKDKSFLFTWLGFLFYVSSDYFLITKEFELTDKMRRIPTLLTYCIAQILIVSGAMYSHTELNAHKEKIE